MRKPTLCELAAFEAGIKLGALYHQFVGTPVSPETAGSLEKAIEDAVSRQPYVARVRVRISVDKLRSKLGPYGYAELSGDMLSALVEVRVGEASATARLEYDEERGYPLMSLELVSCPGS